jgi:AcrR family transcriptional regulator
VTAERTWPLRTATRERNREALLTAAAELLADKGYAASSLGAIARRAGLSTGAVYSIFGSKAELFLELLQGRSRLPPLEGDQAADSFGALLESFGARWAAAVSTPDARQSLELAYELQLAVLREPSVLSRVAQLQREETAVLAVELAAAAARYRESLPMSAEQLASTVIAALQGLAEQALLLGAVPDAKVFSAVARRLGTA